MITNRRAIIGTATYALSDIVSVRITKERSTIICLVVGMMFGACLLILFSFVSPQYNSEIRIVAFIVFGGAIMIAFLVPPNYILHIRSMSGAVDTLRSMDEDYLKRIVDAINIAMVKRR